MNRLVMHVDMNSYFASVEQQANPFLRGKPIGITGKRQKRSVVAAASIEAKRMGVKTAMSTWAAQKICQNLILVPGDPEKYSEITRRFFKIFRDYAAIVEMFSVDEGFLDITNEAEDYTGAIWLGQLIRGRLKAKCGERITASIGIGPNKLMAKLASETEKPNGFTVVQPHEAISFLDEQKLEDLCGIGQQIRQRLGNMGIDTFAQLRTQPLNHLLEEFKSYGYWLHQAAHGIDDSPVSDEITDPKSVSFSYTFSRDLLHEQDVKNALLAVADRVAWRLRRDGFKTTKIHTALRYGDMSGHHQQHQFNEPIKDGLDIFNIAWGMMKNWAEIPRGIRWLYISADCLRQNKEQIPLFNRDRKKSRLLTALDNIQSRYGSGAWSRASTMKVEFRARSSGFHYDHEA